MTLRARVSTRVAVPAEPAAPLVLSVAQMQAVDREAVRTTGMPSAILMENAGRGVAEAVARRAPRPIAGARVRVVCGAGNNGGDGFVVARHLALAGAEVAVVLAAPRTRVGGDAAIMLRALAALPGVAVADLSGGDAAAWRAALAGADVVVDALLGTGLRADAVGLGGVAAVAVAAMNDAPALTIAVDVPSGLDADTGAPRGVAVRADATITMGALKLGLVLAPNAHVGDVEVVGLGVPIAPPPELGPTCRWLTEAAVRASLPERAPAAHKGSSGHLVVVAGSAGKTGAALLTAHAAMRAGAGLVSVASTAAGQTALDSKIVEAMTARYTDGDDADAASYDAIAVLLARPNVRALAIGPGIPVGPGMAALVERLAREAAIAMVLDADALNLLGARAADVLAAAPAPRVVTPHPGEMARLAGKTVGQVEADRLGVARAFAAASRAVVVLKGARTLVVAPDGGAFINPTVEPALATAGSGDVLTGVLGAQLARGLAPIDAANAAVLIHGLAGGIAARAHGRSGVVAGDLPDAVAEVRSAWATDLDEA